MDTVMPTETIWDESFSVGNPILDNQHKKLLRICNDLAACVERNPPDSDSRFHDILNDLSAYAREHFATEEGLLKQLGYPNLVEHAEEHFIYVEKFTEILSLASDGMLDKAGTLMFLSKWWADHILVSDKGYQAYFEHQALDPA